MNRYTYYSDPCPFCGKDSSVVVSEDITDKSKYVTQCLHCGVRSESYAEAEDARKAFYAGKLHESGITRLLEQPFSLDNVTDEGIANLVDGILRRWVLDSNRSINRLKAMDKDKVRESATFKSLLDNLDFLYTFVDDDSTLENYVMNIISA